MTKRLENRLALITGASHGIGAAVAERYAKEGAEHLFIVGRDVKGLEEVDDRVRAAGSKATLVPLDLNELDKIEQMAMSIYERFKRLDILVGCAGILGGLSPLTHYLSDVWEEVVRINLTVNWRLIRAFHTHLLESQAGRGIFVTSGITRGASAYWGAYATSKAALEMMVKTHAEEVKKTNIKINLVNPGAVRTNMRSEAFPGEDPATLPTPEEITDAFVDLAALDCPHHGKVITAQSHLALLKD